MSDDSVLPPLNHPIDLLSDDERAEMDEDLRRLADQRYRSWFASKDLPFG